VFISSSSPAGGTITSNATRSSLRSAAAPTHPSCARAPQPGVGATTTGVGKSAGPGPPGPTMAALVPACAARLIPPDAASHLRQAVYPLGRQRGVPSGLAPFARTQPWALRPGNASPPPRAHGPRRFGLPCPADTAPVRHTSPAGFTERDSIGRGRPVDVTRPREPADTNARPIEEHRGRQNPVGISGYSVNDDVYDFPFKPGTSLG
jgi:hypothetical protein